MSIDLDALFRRWKPDKRTARLRPRPVGDLFSAASATEVVRLSLVLDTTVYIDNLAGKLAPQTAALVDSALLWHCAVCLCELMVGLANYNPSAADWHDVRNEYAAIFRSIPGSRLLTPDDDVWTSAGMIAGTLARTQAVRKEQRKELLNDALIYLTAAKAGLPVLTANRADFDLIQQIAGTGAFIHYQV